MIRAARAVRGTRGRLIFHGSGPTSVASPQAPARLTGVDYPRVTVDKPIVLLGSLPKQSCSGRRMLGQHKLYALQQRLQHSFQYQ
jgi:hypothetical protein